MFIQQEARHSGFHAFLEFDSLRFLECFRAKVETVSATFGYELPPGYVLFLRSFNSDRLSLFNDGSSLEFDAYFGFAAFFARGMLRRFVRTRLCV